MVESLLTLNNVSKWYDNEYSPVLDNLDLEITTGEIVALIGPSGCGKSTLLQIAGLVDKPSSGQVLFNGSECTREKDRTNIRRYSMGYIYQFHHLIDGFSVLKNVMIPEIMRGVSKQQAKESAFSILARMQIDHLASRNIKTLSGGERQRAAIARAAVNSPALILADEPTGNLDPDTAETVFELFVSIAKENNSSMLLVTHNHELAKMASRIVTLKHGQIDKPNANKNTLKATQFIA